MTTVQAITTGAPSYLLNELEAVPQVAAASMNHVTPASAMSIGASFDVLRQNVFFGSRHTEQVIRVLKGKIAGAVTLAAFPNAIGLYLLCALGKEIYLPALPADASSATVTDTAGATAGLSTWTLTNSAGSTYRMGALAYACDAASAHQEVVQIVGISGNGAPGTIVTTKQLKPGAPRASATFFQQPGQHLFTTRGPLDTEAWDLPTMTIEKNRARQWAWRLAGSKVAKMELKGGKEAIEMSNTMVCTVDPVRLDPGQFTVFTPTQAQRSELTRPFTIRDGYVVVANDQDGAGASHLSALYETEEFSVVWDNHTMDADFWNGHRIKDSFVGTTSGQVNVRYATKAGRPSGYEDFLALEGAPPIPFYNTNAINRGSLTVPRWQAMGIYVPSMLVTKADNPDAMGGLNEETIEATIVENDLGDDPLQFFVINDTSAPYAGY